MYLGSLDRLRKNKKILCYCSTASWKKPTHSNRRFLESGCLQYINIILFWSKINVAYTMFDKKKSCVRFANNEFIFQAISHCLGFFSQIFVFLFGPLLFYHLCIAKQGSNSCGFSLVRIISVHYLKSQFI